MVSTRSEIIRLADGLLRQKGYNAFSFSDISSKLNIRNASIHYYFPTKTSLGIALVEEHQKQLDKLIASTAQADPLQKLESFLSIYSTAKSQKKICVVGSLATDLYTVEPEVQQHLKKLVDNILILVTSILDEGRRKNVFFYSISPRAKALVIISSMMAAVQLTRLTTQADFELIRDSLINDLTSEKK